MRILVTGGAGFIGTALCHRLVALGHDVRVLDIMKHGQTALRLPDVVEVYKGGVRDTSLVDKLTKGCDRVVHLASIAGVGSVEASPIRTMRVGFVGADNVLSAAARHEVGGVLLFSSSEVYGTHAVRQYEVSPTPIPAPSHPRWGYAAIKLAAEHLAFAYYTERGLPTASFRIFNTYGPGQLGEGCVRNFIDAALQDKPLIVRGDGSTRRAWCYVDDVVDATVRALKRFPSISGQSLNIGNPHEVHTTLDLAVQVQKLFPQVEIKFVDGSPACGDVQVRIPAVHKASVMLDWEPTTSLAEGLRRTVTASSEYDVADCV